MNKHIIIILIIFCNSFLQGQDLYSDKVFEKQLDYAKELIDLNDYKNAYLNLIEIYPTDTSNAELNYYLGLSSFFSSRKKDLALPYLLKGASFNGNAYYFIGLIYHQEEKFDLAKTFYERYKNLVFENKIIKNSTVTKQIEKIKTAKELIKYKQNIKVENLGKNINSAYPDYAPVLFANGNKLFFTSRRQGYFPEYKDPNDEYFEDVFLSKKINNVWQTPNNIGPPINTKTHDAAVALSENDSILYIYRTHKNLISGNILVSKKLNDSIWSDPIIFDSSINTKTGVESSISIHPDGTKIFFSSNRDGGYGGKDIYFVQKLPNGRWSLPINLGGMINTEEDEDGPFISLDGKTLYFSSKGHKNMGDYDLFKSHLKKNNQWSEPQNMGYPINSVKADIFISTINNEDYFFSSDRAGGFGFSDIYHTILPQKQDDYIVVKGRTIDNTTRLSLRANITVVNDKTGKLEGIYRSNKISGRFIMILRPNEQYTMTVKAQGYHQKRLQINLNKKLSLEDILKTVRLIKETEEVKNE